MKLAATPLPLDASQIGLVLELLEMRALAPQDTAAKFHQLGKSRVFSAAQRDAIELLFELDDDQLANALMRFADDDARDLVRAQLPLEARLSFIAA